MKRKWGQLQQLFRQFYIKERDLPYVYNNICYYIIGERYNIYVETMPPQTALVAVLALLGSAIKICPAANEMDSNSNCKCDSDNCPELPTKIKK